jgi:membrane-associated phospholipid phosphatase
MDWIRFLADHRHGLLTPIFQLFTFLGEIEGYVLLIALVYVAYDKRLAFRLSVLTLVAMSLNHFLKTLIANPRPFVSEGSYAEKWAVSPEKGADLATEYSTPSGHGMAGGAFYVYLYGSVRRRSVRVAAVLLLLATGLSRPYLGVHYLEDVLLGWLLGGALALASLRYAPRIGSLWNRRSHAQQVTIAVGASCSLWLFTRVLAGWSAEGEPTAFVSYLGFLTGIVVAYPLEEKHVRFDPTSSGAALKMLRYLVSVALVLGTLLALDALFAAIRDDASPLGDLLRYVRYASTGLVAMFVAPLLFVRLGLGERSPPGSEEPAEQAETHAKRRTRSA